MPRKRDLETVAAIVVDATLLEGGGVAGVRAAARKHGVPESTVWDYKARAKRDRTLRKLCSAAMGSAATSPDASRALAPARVPSVNEAIGMATAAIAEAASLLHDYARNLRSVLEAQAELRAQLREWLGHLKEASEPSDMLLAISELRHLIAELDLRLEPETLKAVALHTEVISRSRTEMAGVEMARESSERLYRLLEAQLQAGGAQGSAHAAGHPARPN